jgi:putative transposase
MKRFKSARQAQRFLFAHDQINNLFLLPRHCMPATDYRAERTRAFQAWHDVCGIKMAALLAVPLFAGKLVHSSPPA